MPILLSLSQSFVDPELLSRPGVRGVVAPISSSDLQSGHFNASLQQVSGAGLELYCHVARESVGAAATQDIWSLLERLQTHHWKARIILPYHPQSLELAARSVQYGWRWQIEGVKTLAAAAMVFASGAGGIWIQVGALDGFRELDGDELCSQVRSLVDEHAAASAQRPLVVATDLRDAAHVERTIQFGCDRIVVPESLWSTLAAI